MRNWLFSLLLLVLLSGAAVAQQSAPPFQPVGATTALSVTTSSGGSGTLLPAGGSTVVLDNTGANDAFIALGTSPAGTTVTATNGFRIPAGTQRQLNLQASQTGYTYISAITGTGTTSLNMTAGSGVLANSAGANQSGGVTPVQPAARTVTSSGALASNLIVSAVAANLYSFEVFADTTLNASTWYIMIFNSATLPGDGAVTPAKCFPMPQGSLGGFFAFPNPIAFSTGITIGVSTTGCFTKTASTHATFISGDD